MQKLGFVFKLLFLLFIFLYSDLQAYCSYLPRKIEEVAVDGCSAILFDKPYAIVQCQEGYGAYDTVADKFITDAIYDDVISCYSIKDRKKQRDTMFLTKKGDTVKIFNVNGLSDIEVRLEDVKRAKVNCDTRFCIRPNTMLEYTKVMQNGKWGIYNFLAKKWVITPKYDDVIIHVAKDVYTFKVSLNNKWGLLNAKDELLLPVEFDDIRIFDNLNGIQIVLKNNKWAVYELNKNKLGKFDYDYIYANSYDELVVFKTHKQGQRNNPDLYFPVKSSAKMAGQTLLGIAVAPIAIPVFTFGIIMAVIQLGY